MIWRKSYGYADVAKSKLVTPNTRFQAASISKAVTAFAVLKLVSQHRLDLDRDVNEYLRGWTIPATVFTQQEKVTIRRLLNHTAGMTSEGFLGYRKTGPIPTTTDVLNGLGNSPKIVVDAVPGSRFAYSGGGYLVLQKVLEDVTHQSFSDVMHQLVLAPLGMNQSTFNSLLVKNVSLAYDNGKVCDGGWLVYPELAPAGLWTTPSDLAKFSLAVKNAAVGGPNAYLPQYLAKAMLTPSKGLYGFGIMVRGEGEARSFFHAGSNPGGYRSAMINYPTKGVGVVIMANDNQGAALRDEIYRSFCSYYGLKGSPRKRVRTIELSKTELSLFTGHYRSEKVGNSFLEMSLNQDNRLVIGDPNDVGRTDVFVAINKESFINVNNGDKVVFTRKKETGQIVSVLFNDNDVFIKI